MGAFDIELSRISKLFLDRDQTSAEAALARREKFAVTLHCGADVAGSYTLQLAVATAASIANRCFPGAVRVALAPKLAEAPMLVWPSLKVTFGQALIDILGAPSLVVSEEARQAAHGLLFGDVAPARGALRATFDGWIAKVGPAHTTPRLAEREYCSLAGTLAAALGLSELFLSFAEISVEATRRTVALSLWRPDVDPKDPGALGVPVEFLPRDLWVLGLGHLGNAYLWALGTLPYQDTSAVEFVLNDFDKVEPENVETGIIFGIDHVCRLKTRVCSEWLEHRGFRTRLIERRFDGTFRRHEKEPGLALCGFDSNQARRDLGSAQFVRVIESGLGGSARNFDTISLHTLPNPRQPEELWPDLSQKEEAKRAAEQERIARDNPGYQGLGKDDCGRYDLAGKSVAVPFVGVAAASLVVAEALRLAHDGAGYTDLKLSLGSPASRATRGTGNYGTKDLEGLAFCSAKPLQDD